MTRTISLSPLFGSTVGFDRFDDLFDTLARASDTNNGYPPYNIERIGDDQYSITLAVAGFSQSNLNITVRENNLFVSGTPAENGGADAKFLHRGIGFTAFERIFRLADYVVVSGAELKDGLLRINLAREVPEEQKPRLIEIRSQPELHAIQTSKKVA